MKFLYNPLVLLLAWALALPFGLVAQAQNTNYTTLQWDKGSVVPGSCQEPGWFFKTDTGNTYSCTSGHYTNVTGLATASVNQTVGGAEIVAWGDSLTSGTGSTNATTKSYPGVLQTNIPGSYVLNEGVGGDTSTQVLTRFNAAPTLHNGTTIIWAGRNDFSSPDTVMANIAAMVAALPSPKRFLVMSITNAATPSETNAPGNTAYTSIIALNARIQAAYPNNYFDVRSYLIAQHTSSAADLIDFGHDVPPFSLRANNTKAGSITTAITTAGQQAFTLAYTLGSPAVGDILSMPGGELIYLTTVSGNNVTACTRGYAGTTATTYGGSQAITTITEAIHLNDTAYADIAGQVQTFITGTINASPAGINYANAAAFWASPGVIGATTPAPATFTTITANTSVTPTAILGDFTLGSSSTIRIINSLLYFLNNAGAGNAVLLPSGNGNYIEVDGSGVIAFTDNALDLGLSISQNRFRNLYLSGGAYAPAFNYIGTENGANNAIATQASSGPALTAGLVITLQLAHSLQAGANTFAYLGGSALAIKKHTNPASDIGVGYAATGVITLEYNGTLWLDMAQ